MADRVVTTRTLALVAIGLSTLSGCADDDGQGFLLDTLCRTTFFSSQTQSQSGTCRLSGDAVFTTGITSDTLGVRLGPAGGQVEIALASIGAVHQSSWSLEALVASSRAEGSVLGRPEISWGSCGVTCPGTIEGVEVDVSDEVRWAVLVDGRPGAATPFFGPGTSVLPPDATIILRGSDLDVLELRTPGFAQNTSAEFQ